MVHQVFSVWLLLMLLACGCSGRSITPPPSSEVKSEQEKVEKSEDDAEKKDVETVSLPEARQPDSVEEDSDISQRPVPENPDANPQTPSLTITIESKHFSECNNADGQIQTIIKNTPKTIRVYQQYVLVTQDERNGEAHECNDDSTAEGWRVLEATEENGWVYNEQENSWTSRKTPFSMTAYVPGNFALYAHDPASDKRAIKKYTLESSNGVNCGQQ